ncbi:exodeoxyribonuclease I [Buchnera aphidicola]|uniref:Exodeoxyribonuclease I n=1 Tax=Buchnera aphidicola (Cinara strobi) TaxID=1921549 RepID=A0A3B1DX45_9GAMM|nr:exodeoxyribonuclease I [Buchnera aphidicola]VAX76873.1 Exodeoxyribonuclease I [Buchnera aphidicola (Cinara strobi)]
MTNFSNNSFIFYDYETFGVNVSLDKISQFCCFETDNTFKIVYKKTVLFCFPPLDYLPNPNSILVTRILPQYTHIYGLNEYIFSKKIYNIFSKKKICFIGYNNIKFDDLITRNLFYRNLLDPYEWSWKNGNFSWDLLNILRSFYIFFPNIMLWCHNFDGTVSFKLSDITFINNMKHDSVHDACSDVMATILVMRHLYRYNKDFLFFLYKISCKKYIFSFLIRNFQKPIFYISSFFGSKNNNIGCIMILGYHPRYKNNIIAVNLSKKIKKIFHLYNCILKNNLTIKDLFSYGVQVISLNKSPLFFSYNSISVNNCQRLKINYMRCQKNFYLLNKNIKIKNWIVSLFSHENVRKNNDDIDCKLYYDFFSYKDKLLFKFIHEQGPLKWINLYPRFLDSRAKEIFFRLKGRNFVNCLNSNEKKIWKLYCQKKINSDFVKNYMDSIQKLKIKHVHSEKNLFLLDKLISYMNDVIIKINSLC